jgi:uncharacterized membrane protein
VIPPLFHSADQNGDEVFFASFYGRICHQIPERSLFFDGTQLSLCSRCIGLYGAIFLTSLVAALSGERLRISLILAAILVLPGALDAIFDFTGTTPEANILRMFLGIAAGFGFVAFVFPRYLKLMPR